MPRNLNAYQLQEEARIREINAYRMKLGETIVQITAGRGANDTVVLYALTNHGNVLVNEGPYPGGGVWNLVKGPYKQG